MTEQVASATAVADETPRQAPWLVRCLWVAARNYLVWRKLLVVALVGHVAEPLIWLACIGVGLGSLLPPIEGMPYAQYLCAGMLCSSVMNSASSEALYGAFSRWQFRRTWDAILNAPMGPSDIVIGEWLWAAVKGAISGLVIMLVMLPFGLLSLSAILPMMLLSLLTGLTFAAVGLLVAGLSQREELHTYYFSLILLPLTAISGVFFPIERLPGALQTLANVLPLSHAVALARDLTAKASPADVMLHAGVLLIYAAGCISIAVYLIDRRLMR